MDMEQLQLLADEFNNFTQESRMNTASERKQAIEANHHRNILIKQMVDAFFLTLPEEQRNKKSRWSAAAAYMSQHPDGMAGRGKPWTPQGLARVYQLAVMWQRREASPQMVTPTRKKIFRIITQLLDSDATWAQIAEVLNRKGLHWNPKGRTKQPFTNKSANDFYRHHRDLWPHRPRSGSKAQLSLLDIYPTIKAAEPAELPAPPPVAEPAKAPAPVSRTEVAHEVVASPAKLQLPERRGSTSETSVFKRASGSTSIKVVVKHQGDDFGVVIRYSGKQGSAMSGELAAVVACLQSLDYTK